MCNYVQIFQIIDVRISYQLRGDFNIFEKCWWGKDKCANREERRCNREYYGTKTTLEKKKGNSSLLGEKSSMEKR